MQELLKQTEAREHIGGDFAKAIKLGREDGGVHYKRMLLYFGDVFCFVKNVKRMKFVPAMAAGFVFSNVMTTNMEAFMRTILVIGCGTDWPTYLKSDDYVRWKASLNATDGCEEKKPVSRWHDIFCP